MILAAVFAAPFFCVQLGQITETKLFTIQKGKIAPGSIRLSPDLNHYSYVTADHKMIIDGKTLGPYVTNGAVVYSGDSKDCAFLAQIKPSEPSKLIWNGAEKATEFPVGSIFVAGETGPICWVERKRVKEEEPPKVDIQRAGENANKNAPKENEFSRLVTPEETTDWYEKIEKLGFSDDGKLFFLRTSQKVAQSKDTPPDPSGPTTEDFIVYKGGKKVPRGQILQVYAAPSGGGFMAITGKSEVVFNRTLTKFTGEIYGKPVFSPDGKQMAFRVQFTKYAPDGNQPNYQYYVNGKPIENLQIQSGLIFSEDGTRWVMCGLNRKSPYLLSSDLGLVAFADAGLGKAPAEPYKAAKMVNGKLVCLFQAKRDKPILYIEGLEAFELGGFISAPDTLSVSPDGRHLLLAGSAGEETHAYMVDLGNPQAAVDVLPFKYDLQNLGKGTFVWRSDNEVQFAILKRNDLERVVVRY